MKSLFLPFTPNGKATELPFTASVYLTEELESKLLANKNLTVLERRW